MKARVENNKIVTYHKLPAVFHGITGTYPGGFHLQPDEIHRTEGFFPVLVPEYNPDEYRLGTLYFDESKQAFTYELVQVVYDLETIRQQKLDEFNTIIEEEMTTALNIGVIEKLAMREEIPAEIKEKITALRVREAEVKGIINDLQDKGALIRFSFDRTEIEQSKQDLKSGRKL